MEESLFDKQNIRIMVLTLALVIVPLIIISIITTLKLEESIERQNLLTMKNSINERVIIMKNSLEFASRECYEIAHNPLALELISMSNKSGSGITTSQGMNLSTQMLEKSLSSYISRIIKDSDLYENIFFLNKNGELVIDAANGTYKDFDFKELKFYSVALSGKSHIQDVIESPYSQKPIMIISNPVFDMDNQIIGIAGTVIDFERLTDKVVRESDSSYLSYGIVNSKGLVIAHSNKNNLYKRDLTKENESLKRMFNKMQLYKPGAGYYEFNNIKKVMVFTCFIEQNWHVFCSVNIDVYMLPINDLKRMILFVVMSCTLIACMIILRTSQLKVTNRQLESTLKELKETQSQLIISEKMAALGGLVAGIAHEINTPVGVGVTAVSHLKKKTEQIRELYKNNQMKRSDLEMLLNTNKESVDMIYANLMRASSLIQSFKRIAVDQSSEEKREFNLKDYINEIILSLKPVLKKTAHNIKVECDNNLIINGYPGAFSQIINNFVLNSLKHGYDHSEATANINITVTTYSNMIMLKYADDGKGMEANILEKIFDPFFTTKRGSGGTGMGLNVVYNIVTKELDGTIKCKSELGKGTEFIVIFPKENKAKS